MSEKKILFSLEKCVKCHKTKKLLSDLNEIKMVTYPHDFDSWSEEQKKEAEEYDVLEDLGRTAPILWDDGDKIVGFLRIKKWLNENY
ncbi:MAG: hypothetical protein V5A68_00890 [Candidatus Thermoplasmatota archaeon]